MPDLRFDVRLERGSFRFAAAETIPLSGVTAVVGPSGGGKTTLLRVLAGLEPMAAGRVVHGAEVWQDNDRFVPPHRRGVGFVFQDARLFPHLTVAENVGYGARRRPGAEVRHVVAALGLEPMMQRRTSGLSGGEVRRVALARALASAPRVLFLDEPLTGLDSARKAEVLSHVDRVAGEFAVPIVYVSHAADEIAALADRVLRVEDGRCTGWDPPPLQLSAEVVQRNGAAGRVRIGGSVVHMAVPEAPVDAVTIPRSGLVVTDRSPGRTSAPLVLPARLLDAGQGRMTLDLAGTAVEVDPAPGLKPGQDVWVICAGARLIARRRR